MYLNVSRGHPVVIVGCSFWNRVGIFQQSVPDGRPNTFYFFLMFLVAGLVYVLACEELMLRSDEGSQAVLHSWSCRAVAQGLSAALR